MYFCSLTNPPVLENDHHVNSGELLVETGGTLTLAQRVKQAQVSGLRLEAQRYMESFDIREDGQVELVIPNARRPGYDIVDATNDLEDMREKYKGARQAAWNKKQEEFNKQQYEKFNAHVEEEIKKRTKPKDEKKEP